MTPRPSLPALLLCAAALFTSCATGPKHFNALASPADEFSLFPGGASLYFYIDKQKGKAVYDACFSAVEINDETVKTLLGKTNKIAFAFYPGKDRQDMFILLRGKSYPVMRSALALSLNADWEKITVKDKGAYWKSKKNNLVLAISHSAVLTATDESLLPQAGAQAPAGFDALQKGALAGGWTPLAASFNELLTSLGVPITIPAKNMAFALRPHTFGYEAALRLETQNGTTAKAAAAMFTLMRNNYNRSALPADIIPITDALMANPVKLDGNAVIITTAPISAAQTAALIMLFR